jgi:hypothetical protein
MYVYFTLFNTQTVRPHSHPVWADGSVNNPRIAATLVGFVSSVEPQQPQQPQPAVELTRYSSQGSSNTSIHVANPPTLDANMLRLIYDELRDTRGELQEVKVQMEAVQGELQAVRAENNDLK